LLSPRPRGSVYKSELVVQMPSYSDAEMRAIMGRALQIDSGRSDRFTPEQLRTVAAELGISTQALEVAMYEADSRGVAAPLQQPVLDRSSWAKGLAIAVGALVIAALGFASLRMTVGGRSVARVSEAPAGYVPAMPPRATIKYSAPARAVKTTTAPTKKVLPPPPTAEEAVAPRATTKKVLPPPQ
jgi:hypothetical protein